MSRIEDEVCKKIQARAEQARVKKPCTKCGHAELKYDNKTMERTDLSIVEWMVHLQEEVMDAAVYLERLIADCSCGIHGTESEAGCPYCRRL